MITICNTNYVFSSILQAALMSRRVSTVSETSTVSVEDNGEERFNDEAPVQKSEEKKVISLYIDVFLLLVYFMSPYKCINYCSIGDGLYSLPLATWALG